MFQLLHQYLIEYSRLHMPGIGTLEFAEVPGRLQVIDKILVAPKKVLRLNQDDQQFDKHTLMTFLSRRLDISEEQAWSVYHQYIESVRTNLATRRILYWLNLGAFQKDESGIVQFIQSTDIDQYLPAVPITGDMSIASSAKTLEKNDFTDSAETSLSNDDIYTETVKRDYWWVMAIIIFTASAALIWFKHFVN